MGLIYGSGYFANIFVVNSWRRYIFKQIYVRYISGPVIEQIW